MTSQRRIRDTHITLAHGNGGRLMRELIEHIFVRHLSNPELSIETDAARIDATGGEVMLTTDVFTVQPLEFPGGDIGSLAVHGTVNDLAVSGARPRYLTVNAIIEEGLEIARLERLAASMGSAAAACGVRVVAGDTKVVRRGECGGLYFATTGMGLREQGVQLGIREIRTGDCILVSGPVGDHGTAVLLAREEFGLRGDVRSDSTSVYPLTTRALGCAGLRFMRDPTRGGLGTVAHDIVHATGLSVELWPHKIPVRPPVQAVCEMLGYDAYHLACEGRVVAVTTPDSAESLLATWRAHPQGVEAAIIGRVTNAGRFVVLRFETGGTRLLDELEDDPLPRIC